MDLDILSGLGLPEWVVIFAALVWVIRQTGLFETFKQAVSFRQHRQEDREEAQQELSSRIADQLFNVFDRQEAKLGDVTQELYRIRSQLEIIKVEWVRGSEREADIDDHMWQVAQELAALFLVVEQLARLVEKNISEQNNRSDKDHH